MTGAGELLVDGTPVRVTNLDKILWPASGVTKAEMIRYYVDVAPVLLPHLADHPLTLHRFPDGVEGPHWFETRAPAHPPWVRTHPMGFRSGKDVRAPVVDGLPSLVWAANAGAIELHPFLAPIARPAVPDGVVFDLDPGEPAGLRAVCRVALAIRELLTGLGLEALVKTSGAKGAHLFVALAGDHPYDETKAFARSVAGALARDAPERVTDVMTRAKRTGRVFVDWSQNDAGKSTVAPYSLRGLVVPTVSMPVTWPEVEAVAAGGDERTLVFLLDDVPTRLERHGDLWDPAAWPRQRLPGVPS